VNHGFFVRWAAPIACLGLLANAGCGAQSEASAASRDGGGPAQTQCGGPVQGTIGTLNDQPTAIAVVGCDLYVEELSGGIVKMSITDGAVTSLVARVGKNVYFQNTFSIAHGELVFSESLGGTGTRGPIAAAPVGGGKATLLATSSGFVPGITADSSSVYWTDDEGVIVSSPIGGGTPTTLASGLQGPGGLALQDGTLYFLDRLGDVLSLPASGGPVTTLYKGPGLPPDTGTPYGATAIAVDADNVYFSACTGYLAVSSSSVYRLPRSGGPPVRLASSCAEQGIAVDSTDVYWTGHPLGTGEVSSVPIAGGATRVIFSGNVFITAGPALDATSVYWGEAEVDTLEADHVHGSMMRASK
jgi:hypothetical protein